MIWGMHAPYAFCVTMRIYEKVAESRSIWFTTFWNRICCFERTSELCSRAHMEALTCLVGKWERKDRPPQVPSGDHRALPDFNIVCEMLL